MIILNEDDVHKSLPMKETIEAMKGAYAALSDGKVEAPIRSHIPISPHNGSCLIMPAYVGGGNEGLTLKVVSVYPKNFNFELPIIHAAVLVLNAKTGQVIALLEGSTLTAIRTGAASGAATDLLARQNAESTAIFGAGVQGRTQLEAVCSIRKIKKVYLVDPDLTRAEIFVSECAGKGPIPPKIHILINPDEAANLADIICTATTSLEPVYSENAIRPGTHINGVGSYTLEMIENPPEIYSRACPFVDSTNAVLEEAGETVAAIESKLLYPDEMVELGDVVLGRRPGRISERQITFFKSVGVAVQDSFAAQLAINNSSKYNLGKQIDW